MASISEAEKQRRRESTDSVIGTNAMSGIFLDAETVALFDRYIAGEFTLAELSAAMDLHVVDMLRASGHSVPPHLSAKK